MTTQTTNYCPLCEQAGREIAQLKAEIEKWMAFYEALAESHMVFGGYVDKKELARSVGLGVK